jgi:hypothetical protein
MSNDPNEKIIDAFLSEMLGEEKPAKQPEEIARAVEYVNRQRTYRPSSPSPRSKSLNSRFSAKSVNRWKVISVVVTVILIGLSVGALLLILNPSFQNRFRPTADNESGVDQVRVSPPTENAKDEPVLRLPSPVEFGSDQPHELADHPPVVGTNEQTESQARQFQVADIDRSTYSKLTAPQLQSTINLALGQVWDNHVSVPSQAVGDEVWLARVFDRVFAITPTREESSAILDKLNQNGRSAALSWMIQQPKYRQSFIDHWAKSLAEGLSGGSGSFEQNPFGKSLVAYLRDAIANERNWDQIGFELLSSSGKIEVNSDQSNPVALVAAILFENGASRQQYAEGFVNCTTLQPIACARCHDGYNTGLDRGDYWSIQSCFLQLEIRKADPDSYLIRNRNANPNPGQSNDEVALFYEDNDGMIRAAYPEFNGVAVPSLSGKISDVDRRAFLAFQIIKSDQWHSKIIDEIWKSMLGESLQGRYAGIAESQNPQLQQLHNQLSNQLVADPSIAQVIAAIALSDAFSVPEADNKFSSDQHLFATFQGDSGPNAFTTLGVLARVSRADQMHRENGLLARKFTTTPEFNQIPVAQRAFLQAERPRSKWAAPEKVAQQLDKIESAELSIADKLVHLFMLAQGRRPNDHEMAAMTMVVASSANTSEALSDIWWSLVNSEY